MILLASYCKLVGDSLFNQPAAAVLTWKNKKTKSCISCLISKMKEHFLINEEIISSGH